MGRKGKRKRSATSTILEIFVAIPILTILFSTVAAKMILTGVFHEGRLMVCVRMIGVTVSFIVCLYCAIRMPQKKLLWGSAVAATYALMLMLGNLLFFGIEYGSVIPQITAVISGGICGSMLGAIKRRKYA